MTVDVRRAGVVGAGVMGAAIAAHLSNVGIPVLLLDVASPGAGRDERDQVARNGLERALKASPGTFYDRGSARLITTGNVDDDLAALRNCDIVVEAIVEQLEPKRELFARLEQVRRPNTVVSSNTSGISVNAMAAGLTDEFRRNFLVTHFFNPVRYMKLLEIVPGRDTDPAVVEAWRRFGTDRLGKGVVLGKDTPNFIANRLGVFGLLMALRRCLEDGYGFDEVDTILGEPMGRPRSAIFRTCDLSGLDVLAHVAQGVFDNAPDDERRDVFVPPPLLTEMVARGWLGEKSGQGFYKRSKRPDGSSEILVLDPNTMEYRPRETYRYDSIGEARNNPEPAARIRAIINSDDRAGRLARPLMLDLLGYSARRVPEIADSPADVDDAMRWGFNWALGPFETWDAVGAAEMAGYLQARGEVVPALVQSVLEGGRGSFYTALGDGRSVFIPATASYSPLEPGPAGLTATAVHERGPAILENRGAALLDMGDGVALLEFHSKLNILDEDVMVLMGKALERASGAYRALVVGNDAVDFSAGFNLTLILMAARMRQWAQIERALKLFQDLNMAMKFSSFPVVVAAAGRTLAGGCEVMLHGAKARASAELYCGLVETGVGLIPAGGGCKELLLRSREIVADRGPFTPVRHAFETIAYATVSTSAAEALKLGYLRDTDGVTLDRARLLHDAKADALALAETAYAPPAPATLRLPGPGGRLAMEQQVDTLRQSGKISDHDAEIGRRLAHVLTGGNCSPLDDVTEQQILDLEREAFLSLCGTPKTLERIQHTLTTGKPLRN